MNLTSFVAGADQSDFSLQNLPYGVFTRSDMPNARVGVAIGDQVLDLAILQQEKLLAIPANKNYFDCNALNTFAAEGPTVWSAVRKRLQYLLSSNAPELQHNTTLLKRALIPANSVTMQLPFYIRAFTDFYAGRNHATNVGKLFRPNDAPLLPNWERLPVAYNGRASTVFISGTPIRRPSGQIKLPTQDDPIFSATKKLDIELEVGHFIGVGNENGDPISTDNARSHIFGLVLLNDWSARDIQAFEYQPLGPFLSKSFATSISPWVVPMEALEPFMEPLSEKTTKTVDYLHQQNATQPNIKLKVEIQPKGSKTKTTICETNYQELYWSMEQMLAHHTVNRCIMNTGDLFGSGTISGTERAQWGSLLESTFNGAQPLTLDDGSTRSFLEDGDTIFITGFCEANGCRVGFGTVEGTVV